MPRYDEGGAFVGSDLVPMGWVCEGGDADAALAKVRAAMAGPTQDQAEMWLAELSLVTAKRQDEIGVEKLRVTAYLSRLSAYPADVARAALLDRPWHFWPTWAELQAECERLVGPRRAMIAAIERAKAEAERRARDASSLPAPGRAVETPAEEAARRARAPQIVGDVLSGLRAKAEAEREAEAARRAATAAVWRQRETPAPAEAPQPEVAE